MTREIDVDRFGRVAVLMGGQYAEREISLITGNAVLEALKRQGVDATGIDVDETIITQLQKGKFDRAFVALHGKGGEDGMIQGLLDSIRMPYTGSGVMASALGMDKQRCKWLWKSMGLPTPEFKVLTNDFDVDAVIDELGLPLFIKPVREGSSLGMTKVTSVTQLKDAWKEASNYDTEVMAECCIEGPEYTVGILSKERLPVIRIKTPRVFYDYIAKYSTDTTEYLIPSGLTQEQEEMLQDLSLRAYEVLGCRHWGRVDVMCDAENNFWLLEVNTIPGLTSHSLVPKAAKAVGIDFDELILRILTQTLD